MKKAILLVAVIFLLGSLSTLITSFGATEVIEINEDQEIFEIPDKSNDGFFTENLGQWDEEILFVGETSFGQIGLGKGSIFFNMKEIIKTDEVLPGYDKELNPMMDSLNDANMKMEVQGHVVKYTFENSNDVTPVGANPKIQLNNYFIGNDPDEWIQGARNFKSVVYPNLYDEIDLKYYFSEEGAKYDLVLHPNSDPDDIRIQIDGLESMDIENGDLQIGLDREKYFQDRDLITYQKDDLSIVESNFILLSKNTYGFELGSFDHTKTVVIDPMIFSTYLGGSASELYSAIAEDSNGDVLVLGSTWSSDFPVTTGAYEELLQGTTDIVVSKLQSDGSTLLWATFLGGTGSTEQGTKIMVDDNDDIFIIGRTYSSDFPITAGAFDNTMNGTGDLFITKLMSDGSDLLGSTYIGGDGSDTTSSGDGFGFSKNGNLVISVFTGTSSPNFPTTSGAYDTTLSGSSDIVVFEMKSDCTDLVFSTYVGGAGTEMIRFMEIRPSGEIWLGGYTSSTDFPVSNDAINGSIGGSTDIFFFTLKGDGSDFTYSTYLGGSGADTPYVMKIDDDGYVYMTGITTSTDFPTTVGPSMVGTGDFFVVKIKTDLSDLVYGRFIGGSNWETGSISMGITDDGEAVVSGATGSTDFPTTPGAFDTTYNGGTYDRVIFKISHDGSSLLGSTYFGGAGLDYGTMKVGPNGEIYLGGPSNYSNMPTTDDADDKTYNGADDIIFVEFNEQLTDIVYSSYYGGSDSDSGYLYMNPKTWNIYLGGYSSSDDFPTTSGAYSQTNNGFTEMVIVKVLGGSFGEPLEVYSVTSYSDANYQIQKSSFDAGEMVYIELRGLDSDVNKSNGARVNVSFGFSPLELFKKTLRETGNNTGVYRGSLIIPPETIYCDTLTVYSRKDPTKLQRLFIEPPFRPTSVNLLEVYSDEACTVPAENLDKGETGYVKIIGVDSHPATVNKALANLTSDTNLSFKIPFVLNETGASTGVYIGSFDLPMQFDYFDNFTIRSVRNEAITDTVMIHTPVQIRPMVDNTTAIEDEEYRHGYWNFGYESATWAMDTVATWLHWDDETKELYGTPNNNHVGPWDVLITLDDGKGHDDEHEFTIRVQNTPPNITSEPLTTALEGDEYYLDMNCTDDGQGDIQWSMIPGNSWLSITENTGEMTGIPTFEDLGLLNVSVTVKDGHEGKASIDFQITVEGVNDPPRITTLDIKTGKQGENYYRKYEAHDPDGDTQLTWSLETDASFLTMESDTGVLQGTPGKDDVGDFLVNVTVSDPLGANSSTSFILSIENVNDMPDWVDVPEDTEIIHGQLFTFDVNATDPDPGGFIEYQVSTNPETDMEIDEVTGELEWIASIVPFETTPFELDVTIKANDGELFNRYDFTITVIPTESPTSTIWGPDDGEKMPSDACVLEWVGTDPEEETLIYDVYLHENQAYVAGFREEALILSGYEGDSITLNTLDQGKTYYWTVLPFDSGTFGTCESGVKSFKVNYKPLISPIESQEARTGEEFSLKVSASDQDAEDAGNLIYTLISAPTGMTIKEDTGTIKWKPSSSQEDIHVVTVEVSDGVETTTETFDIEVLKGEEAGFPLALFIGIGAAFLIAIIVILVFLLMRNTKDKTCEEEEEADEESEKIKKEMEIRKKDKEWEAEQMKIQTTDEEIVTVPISTAEAHAGDRDRKYDQPDYEELYGQPAPEMEEGDVSMEELRDHIKETADQLEKLEHPEEEEQIMDDLVSKMVEGPSASEVAEPKLDPADES
jgi:hypothetical protein